MIEVKLSQGAKPGHGGILPAKKNTPEIAAIRGIEPGTKYFYSIGTTNATLLGDASYYFTTSPLPMPEER